MQHDPPVIEEHVEGALARVRELAATDGASPAAVALFREAVWEHHAVAGREMPWRSTFDPYRVLVSEVMLQQTQVDRVLPKYEAFLAAFPDVDDLAVAPLEDVLRLWKGLGYNRRALALVRTAQAIVAEHGGVVPHDGDALLALPGVGPATAAGVRAFAFEEPDVYLETNVRAAVLFAFFPGRDDVPDTEVREVVAVTLDREHPRQWYYALMDLGVALKRTRANPSRASRHHAKQSAYEGSDRQIRGRALDMLLEEGPLSDGTLVAELAEELDAETARVERVLEGLAADGLVVREDGRFRIG